MAAPVPYSGNPATGSPSAPTPASGSGTASYGLTGFTQYGSGIGQAPPPSQLAAANAWFAANKGNLPTPIAQGGNMAMPAQGTAAYPGSSMDGGGGGSSNLPFGLTPNTPGGGYNILNAGGFGAPISGGSLPPGSLSPGQNQYTGAYGGNPAASMPGNTSAPYSGGMPVQYPIAFPGGGGVWGGQPPTGGPIGVGGGGYYNPYQVPQQGGTGPGQPGYYPWGAQDPSRSGAPAQGFTSIAGAQNLGHGLVAPGLQYGGLSQSFADYLMSQVGTGVSPFNLQTALPTGGMTFPGQLTAGMNPLLSNLANFYSGGASSSPGANTLATIANQGISALPEWQAMIAAQQQNINTGAADLKEQLGYMGNIAGSPMAGAMSNYYNQAMLGQNALLGQLQQQNILQGQIPVAQGLLGGAGTMAGGLQQLDQQAIQNMYNEFIRTSPEYNPMIANLQAMGTMYPPSTYTGTFGNTFLQSLGQGLGSFLGNI